MGRLLIIQNTAIIVFMRLDFGAPVCWPVMFKPYAILAFMGLVFLSVYP